MAVEQRGLQLGRQLGDLTADGGLGYAQGRRGAAVAAALGQRTTRLRLGFAVVRPVQRPHPPLWGSASNLESYGHIARRGLGALGVTRNTPEETAASVAAHWATVRHADPAGFAGKAANPHCGAFAIACCHPDDRTGRDLACAAARRYYGDNDAELNRLRFGSGAGVKAINEKISKRSNDELIADAMVVGGDADSCSRVVERWAAIGLDQMVFMLQAGPAQHDDVLRSIELIGEKVIPRFAD